MSYMPSGTPLPPNSQSPVLRPFPIPRIAFSRLCNMQRQLDYPNTGCGNGAGLFSLASLLTNAAAALTSTSAASSVVSPAPTAASASGTQAAAAGGAAAGGTPAPPTGATSAAGAADGSNGFSFAQQRYIAEAPRQHRADVRRYACVSTADEQTPETEPRAMPPWGDATVDAGPQNATALQSWIAAHPWLALAVVAVGGAVLLGGSKKGGRR